MVLSIVTPILLLAFLFVLPTLRGNRTPPIDVPQSLRHRPDPLSPMAPDERAHLAFLGQTSQDEDFRREVLGILNEDNARRGQSRMKALRG